MVIVINARFLLQAHMEGYGNYIEGIFTRVATLMPQHQFNFVLDRPNTKPPQLPKNAQYVTIGPQARHPLLWHYWYNVSLKNYCKKVKAALCISPDGFCTLNSSIPQITIIHDLAFIVYSDAILKSHLWYYKHYTPKFIKKSKAIITVSNFSKQAIEQQYKTPQNKVHIIANAANPIFQPIKWTDQIAIKQQYALENSYFVSVTSIHPRKNIVNLLKAFSIFKKWSKSNMQLVLVGRLAWKNSNFEKLLSTYKYKNDVKLLGYLPTSDVALLVASAYAMVYVSKYEGFGVPIIEAMQCGTPVVTSNNSGMLEAGGNAALYADPNNVQDIANQMQLIYKDENLRSQKIADGLEHCKQFNWNVEATKMVQLIEDVLQN